MINYTERGKLIISKEAILSRYYLWHGIKAKELYDNVWEESYMGNEHFWESVFEVYNLQSFTDFLMVAKSLKVNSSCCYLY